METEKAILEKLRKRFIEIRNKEKISTYKLGETSGVDPSNISKFELGKRNMKIENLVHLFDKMGYILEIKVKPKRIKPTNRVL